MKKLEGKELYRRLQEAKNAKRLHAAAMHKNAVLEQKLSAALQFIEKMSKQIVELQQLNESQALLLEEYRRIIFGKKKRKMMTTRMMGIPTALRLKKNLPKARKSHGTNQATKGQSLKL